MVLDSCTKMGQVLAGLSHKADFNLGDNFVKFDVGMKFIVQLVELVCGRPAPTSQKDDVSGGIP